MLTKMYLSQSIISSSAHMKYSATESMKPKSRSETSLVNSYSVPLFVNDILNPPPAIRNGKTGM